MLYVQVMFPQMLYDIVLYARHFLPVKFFPQYYFYKLCFGLPMNNARDYQECRDKWGKIGPSHLLNDNGDL